MWKKGPKEKEKILHRLTEKEIKDQLYSFKAKEIFSSAEPEQPKIVKEVEKVKQQQELQKPPKQKTSEKMDFYKLWQGGLFIIFFLLILFSIRQIVKAIFNPRASQAKYNNQQYEPPRPVYKSKGSLKR